MARKGFMDIRIEDHGSVCVAIGTTDEATEWIDSTAPDEACFWNGGLVLARNAVEDFAAAAEDAGFGVDY